MRSSRRSPTPPSWLAVVEGASAAFTGTAQVLSSTPADATQTSFRGAGYTLSVQVTPVGALFGPLPAGPVTYEVQTALPPERRQGPDGPRFPPDSLHEVPYADQAVAGPVLVVQSDPPVLRALVGPGDDLPDAVRTIHGWLQAPPSPADVAGASPVAAVAGVELLARTTSDLPGLVARVLPGLPETAARGLLALPAVRALPPDALP